MALSQLQPRDTVPLNLMQTTGMRKIREIMCTVNRFYMKLFEQILNIRNMEWSMVQKYVGNVYLCLLYVDLLF
jgi:hypothetical protein